VNDFYIPTWDEIEKAVLHVAEKAVDSGFIPDVIVAIPTGGVVPSKLLKDAMNVDRIRYIEIKLYKNVGEKDVRPVVRSVCMDDVEGKKVLVVDDVADSGETLEVVSNVISMFSPGSVRYATVYVKPWARKYPDFYYKTVDKWIIFPWDKWDVVREKPEVEVDNKELYLRLQRKLNELNQRDHAKR